MVLKIPPPPHFAGSMWQLFNRWLLELTSILNSAGAITATAVTQPPGDDSTNIATTAFVLANTASTPSTTVPLVDATPGEIGVSVEFARGDHVHPTDGSRAGLASPPFTGTPTAPTAAPLTNDTQLATTAYADSAVSVEKTRATTAEALLAPLASPALTGVPTAPTAAPGTNTTQVATTAFVEAAVAGGGTSNPVVKAAVNFTVAGGVVTIVNSFNIASVVRTATGKYTVNFTAPFIDANYYVSTTAIASVASAWGQAVGTQTAGACPLQFVAVSGGAEISIDPGGAYAVFFE